MTEDERRRLEDFVATLPAMPDDVRRRLSALLTPDPKAPEAA